MVKHKNKQQNKKLLIIGIVVALLLVGGAAFALTRNNTPNNSPVDDGINFEPATEDEKAENDRHKEDIVKQNETAKTPGSQPEDNKNVEVIITGASQNTSTNTVEVRGYANTFDDNGTCSLQLQKNSVTVSTSKAATQNVSTMSCGKLTIERSKLSAGTWTAILSYKSSESSGRATRQIEVK